MAEKPLSELFSLFNKDKAATFFKENYRVLFGDQFNPDSLKKLITESYEDVTPASSFRRLKKDDPEFFKKYVDSYGVSEEELLRHGHTVTKQRFIGRSHKDMTDSSRAFASGNSRFRNERAISGTLFDKATELEFNNADDFKIFENLYNFNESTYGPWRSPKSVPGKVQHLDSKKDFFNQYIEYYKEKNKLSETGAIKKLQEIEQKAKEMNLSGYDFGDLIEKRKILNQEYKANRQEGHRISREYKVKSQRLDEIEQEMKNFRMNSPEYKALEKEYNNIYSDLYSGSAYKKEVLQLNAPREGAPMFEGGAVPSVIADSEDFDQYAKYNQSNSQVVNTSTTKNTSTTTNTTASSAPQSIVDNLKPGDNILDDSGHLLIYSNMDPVNKEMGIAFDSYNFYDVTEGRMAIYRNKDAMNKYLKKTDNTISLDKAKEINQARSSFYNEFKRFNDLTYNPETTSIEEFDASQRRFFEQRVVPARDEFFNLYDNLENKDLVKFDYNENKFFNLYDKQLKHYQKLDETKEAIVNNANVEKPSTMVLKNGNSSYRPKVTMNGNNVDFDSIYNHSVPKRVNKNNAPHPNYKSKFEPIEETTKKTIKTQKRTDANNTKIKNETIEKLNKTKQMYEGILTDWTSASGDFNRQINTRTVGPHNIYVEGKQYLDDIEDLKNNYNVDDYVDGSYTMEQEVFKYSEGKGINGEDVLKVEGDLVDAPNAYASDLNKTLEEAKKTMSPEEYQKYKNNFDVEKALVKTDAGQTKLNRKRVVRNKAGLLDDIGKPGAIMTGLNILGAVGDYKDARRKGHGVISSAARAGVQFAVGEALGLWAIPVMAAKEVPGLVMKGAETLYKENRRMNSAANFQTFGDAQFQDTQQLATMRQSGMEMAKMSQYNLQQTLMGNEATYLHR